MEEAHLVYRIDENGDPEVLNIKQVLAEVAQGKSRGSILAGGLVCSHNSRMTYAVPVEKAAYFRHVTNSGSAGEGGGAATGCGCCSKHRRAQELLQDNDYNANPVTFACFRECGRHTSKTFVVDASCDVELEVREVNDADGKFVTDVLYRSRDDGNVLHRVEVWNKHKTSPESRCGKAYVEVNCSHVLEAMSDKTGGVVLKCEFSSLVERCLECEERLAKRKREREEERKKEAKREEEAAAEQRRIQEALSLECEERLAKRKREREEERKALMERERELLARFEEEELERKKAELERKKEAKREEEAAAEQRRIQEALMERERELRARFEEEERQERLERQQRIEAAQATKVEAEKREKTIKKIVVGISSTQLSKMQATAKRMFSPRVA